MSLQTRNPATGDVLDTYPEQTPAEVHGVLDQAVAAQRRWQDLGFAERARGMRAVAEALEARADTFARLMALEMGKTLAQGASEARKSAATTPNTPRRFWRTSPWPSTAAAPRSVTRPWV